MKKKNLKSLKLNKNSISNLNPHKGGTGSETTIRGTFCDFVKNFTDGECFDTLGDDHCWTPTPNLGW